MNNYWQKRYEKLKLSEMKKAEITAAKQKEIYQETLTQLRQQVLDWYDKYARENNISLADAQEQLTTSENKEFKITLEKYGELAKKENLSSEYKRLLENVSMKVRHARSQKLYIDTIHLVEQLAKTQKIQLEELLKDVYEDSVYKTAYEVQTMQGKYTQMQGLNEKEINEIIKKPWTEDGKEFSTRIWENKQKLVQTLTREMTRAFILKESTSRINERITKRFNVSYNEAKRLIETETAYIQEKAMLETYDKLNVEKYEILAVLDSKTSEICRQMDGKVFERKDAKAGITLPPFHCYCRSTTVPYIEELDEEETRAARDKEGKTEFVPKMSYEEWKKKYINNRGREIDYLIVKQPKVKTVKKNEIGKRDAKGSIIYAEDYMVDIKAVNSKSYRDKFEKLSIPKQVQDSLHKEAIYILNKMNGKANEIVSALDVRTGEILARSDAEGILKSSFNKKQYEKIILSGKKIVLVHNHPGGGRFSFVDIKTCFKNDMIAASVVIGHDGSVRIIHDFDRSIDIESLYRNLYNDAKEIYPLKSKAEEYALTKLYKWGNKEGGFKYGKFK